MIDILALAAVSSVVDAETKPAPVVHIQPERPAAKHAAAYSPRKFKSYDYH